MKEFVKNLTPPIIWSLLRKIQLKNRRNKIVIGRIGKFNLLMNSDHSIIRNIALHPSYSSNLPRIVAFTQKKYMDMSVVDVGANIGDGVSLIRTKIDCPIICIEGDPEYYSLLEKNLKLFNNTTSFNCFLGETEEFILTDNDKKEGTLRIREVSTKSTVLNHEKIKTTTLDKLVKSNHKLFLKAKVLKIDTDGYDLKIIRGAIDFIKQNKPVIFFEYDRIYLDALDDKGLPTLNFLKKLGYDKIVLYDNYGRFLVSTRLEDKDILNQLDAYIEKRGGAFPYYDICLFHEYDTEIALNLIRIELLINRGQLPN